ncbi:hypothetical protein KCP74_09950 [Salmonella enterica subsp. enterica]|nr:hypothetical protein KCP74_09950 [Salmonella enterica subsp. enterica]
MPDGGVNVLSGLHAGIPRRFFEIHHKIIAFRRQNDAGWLFCWRQDTI